MRERRRVEKNIKRAQTQKKRWRPLSGLEGSREQKVSLFSLAVNVSSVYSIMTLVTLTATILKHRCSWRYRSITPLIFGEHQSIQNPTLRSLLTYLISLLHEGNTAGEKSVL